MAVVISITVALKRIQKDDCEVSFRRLLTTFLHKISVQYTQSYSPPCVTNPSFTKARIPSQRIPTVSVCGSKKARAQSAVVDTIAT
jgi:hypothetical protein